MSSNTRHGRAIAPPDAPVETDYAPRVLSRLGAWIGRLFEDDDGVYAPVRFERALLVAIFALAVVVRLLGINLGLPYLHHWDEVLVTSSARGMIERGDDAPASFFYGAPIMRLTVAAWHVAKALHLHAVLAAPPGEEIVLRWVTRPVVAILAASGAIAVYLAGRSSFRRGDAALWGALLYAVSAELVWHSRYLVTDASVTALTAWTIALAAVYAQRRTVLDGALAIVAAGLTFSFKLTGLATVILPAGVLLLRPPRAWTSRSAEADERFVAIAHRILLLAAVPAVVAIFLWLNPHVRSDWRHAFADFEGIARHYREGHVKPFSEREPGLQHLASALFYLAAQEPHTSALVSLAITGFSLFGLVLAIRAARPAVVLAAVHAFGVVFAMAWPNRAYLVRQFLPAVPVLCIGFGLGMATALERAKARVSRELAIASTACVAIALTATTIVQSVLCQRGSEDPRMRAMDVVARRARELGREVGVAPSTAVDGALALGGNPRVRSFLARPGVVLLGPVGDARSAAASGADFVVVASHRELAKIWPYEEQWAFQSVPGYREIARFSPNPYEERWDIVPTWDGRTTAIVLEKEAR